MKILFVADIAPTSTRDCFDGLRAGFASLGHEVITCPTWAYAGHMLKPYDQADLSTIPENVRGSIFGTVALAINGMIDLEKPDAVIVVSGWIMPRVIVERVREKGIRTALYLTESPYQDLQQAEHEAFGSYDVVLCNELSSMPFLSAQHDNVVYLPHSYNPEVHKPTPCSDSIDFDAFMAGTGFTERRDMIAAADWGGARVKLVGFWPGLPEGFPASVVEGTIANAELPGIYSAVPINLNIHRTTRTWKNGAPDEEHIDYAESVGPRVLEVLACGGFLLTDHRAELDSMGLRDGEHLATFANAKELGDKARHYLQHGDERRRIAAAGMAAVRGCTFSSRCESIILPALMKGTTHGR